MLSSFQPVKFLKHLVDKVYGKVSLRSVLIVPFVLQIFGIVALTGYLEFSHDQQAVRGFATQLENEVSERIYQHLGTYLAVPKQINQINSDAIDLGLLNLKSLETTGHYFWKQMQVFNVGYINFANPQGEFIGVERLDNGNLLIIETTKQTGLGKQYNYATDSQGNRTKLLEVIDGIPVFPAEAWYVDAVKAGKPVWSQIYQWEDKPVLSISNSYPIYDSNKNLIGVIGVDFILSQISDFLKQIKVGKSGKTFILERSGLMVAASSAEITYTVNNGQAKRLLASESEDPLIRLTTQHLIKRFGNLNNLKANQQLIFTTAKGRYLVQVKPWQDELGLDWLILVVVPEADFAAEINADTHINILLCLTALIIATMLGIITAKWVTKPILQLNVSAKKIAKGKWDERVEIKRSDELGQLGKSFNSMAKQLQESFASLESKNTELKLLNEALSESQSQVAQFLEAMPVGVFVTDANGKPYYINLTGNLILGQGVVESATVEKLPQVYQAYLAGSEQLYPSERHPILRALQGESITVDDMEIRRADKVIPIEASGTPIYDEWGNITFAIITFADITQRKQAEKFSAEHNRILEAQVAERTQELTQALNQLQATQEELIQSQQMAAQGQEAAERANRAKSEFLASMSHELRTPLNAILGFTQVMSRDDFLSTQHQQHLEIINRAGEHLLNLINDILEMSKIEAGRTTLNENSFDLYRLLDSLHEMLQLRAKSKGLELTFRCGSEVPRFIRTDESKLCQVLLNLLGNAIKFTEIGSVILRVKIAENINYSLTCSTCTLNHLFFEVEDTGPGIAPAEIDLLFQAFGQTETGRKSQQGTGLGLPISYKYVQLMGGDISVISTPGQGSLFAFNIQITPADSSEIPIAQIKRKVIGLVPNQSEYRILVVDDRFESRLLLATLFTSIGFTIKEAENGREAIAVWESWQPHLIWMDMRMPVMDGYEATSIIKLREHQQRETGEVVEDLVMQNPLSPTPFTKQGYQIPNHRTVIIALTANAFEEERQMFLQAGCDDFVRKPLQEEVLLAKVSEHLGVQYIFQEESPNAEDAREKTEIVPTEADLLWHLNQVSASWVAEVHHAAAICSDNLILELIEQLPPNFTPLAKALTALANDFQFEQIMQLTQWGAE